MPPSLFNLTSYSKYTDSDNTSNSRDTTTTTSSSSSSSSSKSKHHPAQLHAKHVPSSATKRLSNGTAELLGEFQDLTSSSGFSSTTKSHPQIQVPPSSARDPSSTMMAKTPYLAPLDDMRADSGYHTGVSITEDGKSTATGTPMGEPEFFDAEEADEEDVEDDIQREKFPYRMERSRGGKTGSGLALFDDDDEEEEEEEEEEDGPVRKPRVPQNQKSVGRSASTNGTDDLEMRDALDPIEDSEADDEPVRTFRLGDVSESGSEDEQFVEAPDTLTIDDDEVSERQGGAAKVTVIEDDAEDEDGPAAKNQHIRSPQRKKAKKKILTAVEDADGDEVTGFDLDDIIADDDEAEEEIAEMETVEGKKFTVATIRKEDTEERRKKRKRQFKGVIPIGLRNPRSRYQGWTPPYPLARELTIIDNCGVWREDGYRYISIDEFEIYTPASKKRIPFEFIGLNMLNIAKGHSDACIDAVVKGKDGKPVYYLHNVRFKTLSIGNYCDTSAPCVGESIWIQTDLAKGRYTWYELGRPSSAYAEYHTNFVWIANLTKYFIDYISDDAGDRARHDYKLADFRYSFHQWLEQAYGACPEYRKWKAQHPSNDFRQAIVANKEYIFKEVFGLGVQEYCQHHIWSEVQHTEYRTHASDDRRTVVTPLVYDIFKDAFGPYMQQIKPKLPKGRVLRSPEVLVATPDRLHRDEAGNITSKFNPRQVNVGSLIGIPPEGDTKWKADTSKLWYAYVHEIIPDKKDIMRDRLNVVWLYQPDQTILKGAPYPFKGEIFFSDHCNCSEMPALRRHEVVATFSVTFFCGPGVSGTEFFIRQKFLTATGSFVTMHQKDLKKCGCEFESDPYLNVMGKFKVGDTVLIKANAPSTEQNKKSGERKRNKGADILEPAIVLAFIEEEMKVRVRTFYRRGRDFKRITEFAGSKPNHLVLAAEEAVIEPNDIVRGCRIRCFAPDEEVSAPYCYGGTGDCFFVTECCVSKQEHKFIPYPEFDVPFNQGFDLNNKPIGDQKPMAGMDLYCGGGNFGRGLEEGGAIQNKWAVDYEAFAVHTYSKNMLHDTAVYYGSVNDFLKAGLTGEYQTGGERNPYLVPKPGEVDFISAGSPCQGFSNANQKKYNEKSMFNASLVASVAAYVDFYRPKYALLENVLGIASMRKHKLADGEMVEYNVYSMMLTSIIAMGYQTQMFLMDAWSHGSPQSRTRMFLEIAAPGYALPGVPPRSHSHPFGVKGYALKEAPNGGRYAARQLEGPCPFPFVSIGEACADLPRLGDTHVNTCIPFPDHRSPRFEDREKRALMRCIPKYKNASAMVDAIRLGYVPETLQLYSGIKFKQQAGCKSWKRVHGDQIVRTITTALQPSCAFTGQWMHWDEHRLLTVMEARRAQGFPDHEVLNASAPDAFMICGNSVARQVAVALGIYLREAWMKPSTPADELKRFPPARPIKEQGIVLSSSRKRKTVSAVIEEDSEELMVISETQVSQTSTQKRKRTSLATTKEEFQEELPVPKRRNLTSKSHRQDTQSSSSANSTLSPRSTKQPKSSFFRSNKELLIIDDSSEPEISSSALAPSTIPATATQTPLSTANLNNYPAGMVAPSSVASMKRQPTPDSLVSEEVKSTEIVGVDADGIELW